MTTIGGVKILAITGFMLLYACEKTGEPGIQSMEGTYIGTLVQESGLKNISAALKDADDAFAEITIVEDGIIEVYCHGDHLDTTFMLNYYDHDDSIMVCNTGDDFESLYGHMLGSGHMGGPMMGDIQQGESEWIHHLHDEHDESDEHFGGFNMDEGMFTYTFRMMDQAGQYHLTFQGAKE